MMNSSSTTVSAELGLRLVAAEQPVIALVASLHYSGSDPYAIRMAFHVGTEEPVEWIFARDLLADGLMTPEGDGDVLIWPSSPVIEPDGQTDGPLSVLNIKLSSPFGEAHFEAPAEAIAPGDPGHGDPSHPDRAGAPGPRPTGPAGRRDSRHLVAVSAVRHSRWRTW